jgi:hypothetical protein
MATYLQLPVLRLTKYHLLLHRFLRLLDIESEAYLTVSKALSLMKNVNDKINSNVGKSMTTTHDVSPAILLKQQPNLIKKKVNTTTKLSTINLSYISSNLKRKTKSLDHDSLVRLFGQIIKQGDLFSCDTGKPNYIILFKKMLLIKELCSSKDIIYSIPCRSISYLPHSIGNDKMYKKEFTIIDYQKQQHKNNNEVSNSNNDNVVTMWRFTFKAKTLEDKEEWQSCILKCMLQSYESKNSINKIEIINKINDDDSNKHNNKNKNNEIEKRKLLHNSFKRLTEFKYSNIGGAQAAKTKMNKISASTRANSIDMASISSTTTATTTSSSSRSPSSSYRLKRFNGTDDSDYDFEFKSPKNSLLLLDTTNDKNNENLITTLSPQNQIQNKNQTAEIYEQRRMSMPFIKSPCIVRILQNKNPKKFKMETCKENFNETSPSKTISNEDLINKKPFIPIYGSKILSDKFVRQQRPLNVTASSPVEISRRSRTTDYFKKAKNDEANCDLGLSVRNFSDSIDFVDIAKQNCSSSVITDSYSYSNNENNNSSYNKKYNSRSSNESSLFYYDLNDKDYLRSGCFELKPSTLYYTFEINGKRKDNNNMNNNKQSSSIALSTPELNKTILTLPNLTDQDYLKHFSTNDLNKEKQKEAKQLNNSALSIGLMKNSTIDASTNTPHSIIDTNNNEDILKTIKSSNVNVKKLISKFENKNF